MSLDPAAGVRVDTWVETGTEISPFYDSLIAKLMVHGKSREDAVCKMRDALSETYLGGIPNNLEYLKAILASKEFGDGEHAPIFPPLPESSYNGPASMVHDSGSNEWH